MGIFKPGLFTVTLTALFLSGCAGKLVQPGIPSVIAIPAPKGVGNYTLEDYKSDLDAYKTATGDAAKKLRNRVVYQAMAEIDYVFYNYETSLFVNQGKLNVGSDFLQLGLAAGSTLTNGARAKTILTALLSGVTGLGLSVDKNFFRQQTVQAIASSMEGNRDKVKAIILQELTQDTTAYPLEAARSELIKYFFAGTLSNGLQQLSQDAGATAKTQAATLGQVQVSSITAADVTGATDINSAIAKAFGPGGDLTKVRAWLKAMGAVTVANPTKDLLEAAIRELGGKVLTDTALRTKYFDEARKAGLIR